MTRFGASADAVAAHFQGLAGESIRIGRGAALVEATAWRSPQPLLFASDTGAGALIEFEAWEWHLAAGALGDLERPRPGDRITAADGRVYEVVSAPGGACYSGDAILRIHTRLVEEA